MRERFESLVERQIREAQERGDSDDLPGRGRPLRNLHAADDENWWARSLLERENVPLDALLPTPLQLRKEVERLPETVRDLPTEDAVREVVRALNTRIAAWIRTPTGPRIAVGRVSVDDVVAQWRAQRRPDRAPGDPASADPGSAGSRAGNPASSAPGSARRRRRLGIFRRR